MSDKEVDVQWYVLLIFFMLIIIYVFKSLIMPTGYFVSPETSTEKIWGFDTAGDYMYSSSQINLSDGKAQLLSTTTTSTGTINELNVSALVSATEYEINKDPQDRMDKVNSLGQGHVELKENKSMLEVKLNKQFQNNDILSLYIKEGSTTNGKIYLCAGSTGCEVSEQGEYTLPTVPEEGAWYNLTLSGISSAKDTFFIDSPDKIKIDMVQGFLKSSRTETTTSTSYPSSSSIETTDFQPANWKAWGTFFKTEQLNGQTVHYFYSTNSGLTWISVPSNVNLSSVTGSKIKFKIELNSNTTTTPIVDTLTLTYTTQQVCTENWTIHYDSCLLNDSKLNYYVDTNECGTTSSLPADNNTYVSCDYCALFNCSQSMVKKMMAEMRENKIIYIVDARDEANTKLEIEGGTAGTTVDMIYYTHNIQNETPPSIAVNKYVDIESNTLNITSVKILLYYNESEIAALDENTLKIYYYNETSKQWDVLPSVVNTAGNYVYAVVPHLSLYGLFGEQPSSASGGSSSSTSGGGGSGGGSRRIATAVVTSESPVSETTETFLPTRSEPQSTLELNAPASKTSCEYVVEMSLPDEIVLGEDDSYEGEIINKGNCGIPELKLGLSPELKSKIDLSTIEFSDIQPGDKQKFILIRKKAENKDLFSATSYVIGSLKTEKNLLGRVILRGYDETGEIFGRELPVSIVLRNSFPGKELVILGLIAAVLLIFAVRMWQGKEGKKKR